MSRTIGLQITLPDGKTLDREFEGDSVLIGSGPSAVLRIEDSDVSSIHAVIKVTAEGEATVVDLGSEAGTSVGGKAASEPIRLSAGDTVELGKVKVKLVKLGGAAAEKAADKAEKTSEAKTEETPAPVEAKAEPKKDEPKVEATKEEPKAEKQEKSEKKKKKDKSEDKSEAPTQLMKDPHANSHHAPPAAALKPVTAADDIDERVLTTPLPEAHLPTAEQHGLQINVLWGTDAIDSVIVREPRDVIVAGRGHKARADLNVEIDLPVPSFTVATNRGTEASIVIPAGGKVALRKNDGTIVREPSLQATDAPFPAKTYSIGFGERLVFKVGTLTFVAQYVRGEASLGKGKQFDWFFPRIWAISAMLHGFIVVAAFVTPRITSSITDDLFKNQNRFAQMILKAPEKEKKKKTLDLSGSKGGAKHKGEEGKFGKKDKPPKDALASKAGAPRVDPNKREKDRQIALNSGLLGILGKAGGSAAVSNVFGPGGLGTGINNAMGGLRGTDMGDAGGAGGLGTRGAGAGGGGNSLGIGGLGTQGHGRGTGGYGNIDLGGRGKGETRIVPGKTIVEGALAKEEIGRVIRRNLARFKFCYEKQLNANPNLQGKVSVYFTIAPTGGVADASVRETSMNDENVEQCVLKVMRSLKFPQPRGGGIVVVTYPFVFAST